MTKILFALTIILFTSCAASRWGCPNEQAGKAGKPHDKNLNRKVATRF